MIGILNTRMCFAACAVLWLGSVTAAHAGEPAASACGATVAAQRSDVPDGCGVLRGRFVYAGTPPDAARPAGGGERSESGEASILSDDAIVVEPTTRGIKNVVIYARSVPRVHPSYNEASTSSGAKVLVELKQHAFDPRILALQLSQSLTVRNRDPVVHVFLMRPPMDTEINVLLSPGSQAEWRFAHKQYLPVVAQCSFHPWMKAYVLVRNDPYFALSDAYGSFEIRDLPAGEEIEFQAWHELGRGPGGTLVARPDWTKGRLRVTIPRDGVVDLGTIEVLPAAFQAEERPHARTVRDAEPLVR